MKYATLLLLLLAAPALAVEVVDSQSVITYSGENDATLSIPRWKMAVTGKDTLYALIATNSSSQGQLYHSFDGGASWDSTGVRFDGNGYLDMHVSLAAGTDGLWATFPNGSYIEARKVDFPASSTSDEQTTNLLSGTSLSHRSGVTVDGDGRVWVFTRLTDTASENIEYHYTDDDGANWTSGNLYTGQNEVRLGAFTLGDGTAAVGIHYFTTDAHRYYAWNGSSFDARADSAAVGDNLSSVYRAFSWNAMDGSIHLVYINTSDNLMHTYCDDDDGTGSWSTPQVVASSPTSDIYWSRPTTSVRGDKLYIFYAKDSTGLSDREIYVRVWDQGDLAFGDELQLSDDSGNHSQPNTAPSVPTAHDEVPVMWVSGSSSPYTINYASVIEIDGAIEVAGGTWTDPYEITESDTTYRLTGDVTAEGTAFAWHGSADNTTLDFNGHTVTYHSADDGNLRYGIYLAGSSAVDQTPPDVSGADGDGGVSGARITGGTLQEYSSAVNDSCHAILMRNGTSATIDSMTIRFASYDTRGVEGGTNGSIGGVTIQDCYIYDDGDSVTNRHQIHASLEFDSTADARIDIIRNTIIGSRQQGIQIRRNTTSVTDSMIIRGNTIYPEAAVTNAFAIGAAVGHLSEIAWNTIKADGGGTVANGGGYGRGIHLAGVRNNLTHNNTVEVLSRTNNEYSRYPTWGIQVEDSPVNVTIRDNQVTAYGTVQADGDEVPAGALRFTAGASIDSIYIYDNTFEAYLLDSDGGSGYLSENGVGALNFGSDLPTDADIRIYDNTFRSNQGLIFWDWDVDGDAPVVEGNTYLWDTSEHATANATTAALWCYGSGSGGTPVWTIADAVIAETADEYDFNGGTGSDSVTLRFAATRTVGFSGLGNGATITATSAVGGLTVEGTSASDSVALVLPEWSIAWSGSDTTITQHNPWTISASGETSYEVTVDAVTAQSALSMSSAIRSDGDAVISWSDEGADSYQVQIDASGVTIYHATTTGTTITIPDVDLGALDVTVWPITSGEQGTPARTQIAPE